MDSVCAQAGHEAEIWRELEKSCEAVTSIKTRVLGAASHIAILVVRHCYPGGYDFSREDLSALLRRCRQSGAGSNSLQDRPANFVPVLRVLVQLTELGRSQASLYVFAVY